MEPDAVATRERVLNPFSENPSQAEFYFGQYEWRRQDFSSISSKSLLTRSSGFLISLDKLWASRAREQQNKRVPQLIAARRGQAKFRSDLLVAYSGRCAVTGSRTEAVLEAAHLETKHGRDIYVIANGILLRSDIHTLFDLRLLAIRPSNFEVAVHAALSDEYQKLAGRKLEIPRFVDRAAVKRRLKTQWEGFQRARKLSTP